LFIIICYKTYSSLIGSSKIVGEYSNELFHLQNERLDFLSYVLPEGMLSYFELESIKSEEGCLVMYLREKNIIPEEIKSQKLVSKGFYESVKVQDFPLRGKKVYLEVKRRRWMDQDTGEIVKRNWELLASGTRITKEFATFLKGINRY